ncbi:hypothetical protein [uncultured Peptoniphilus sp.]|uniref:hypothetical protein n=1 Tax=uncultured Peptoniphilus sp. TaxID=254354 RepID=UPI00259982A1|nr:hypothetical protein [uncultured Peptoniphilus sp.]
MKVINKIKDKLKKIEICIRHFGGNVMKKNINLVIAFVSLILILVWMHLFMKYSESSVVNISFLAINTLLIVYLIEAVKSKKNINMEGVVLISSIIFVCICCFMEYINKITLPFIILSLLIVYLFNFLILALSYLNIPRIFIITTLLFAAILGAINKSSWEVLAFLFISIKTYISYLSNLYEINQEKDDDYKKNKNIYKLNVSKIEVKLDFMTLFIYSAILLSDYLLVTGIVECLSKNVFGGSNKIEMILTKGFLTIAIFEAFLLLSILLGIVIKKYFPDMEKNIIERILNEKF